MKILGSFWFTPGGSMHVVGIVKTINEMKEIKYYIGTSIGSSQEEDSQYIADYGSHFPFEVGEKLLF
jgi:hypothetical protein